jgi:hypothetical protein
MTIELRFLQKAGTTTKPAKLQYRSFDQVEGWSHSEWSGWKDVPTVIEGQDGTAAESGGAAEPESGGSVMNPVGLQGFQSWVEP